MLHEIDARGAGPMYCGPTVIASIANVPAKLVKERIREISGHRRVTGVGESVLVKTLQSFGLKVSAPLIYRDPLFNARRRTFWQWYHELRVDPKGIYVVVAGHHYVAVYGDYFIDSMASHGKVIPIGKLESWKRARVSSVYKITRNPA